mmetsp:Transcript_2185/g.6942  ORF Transcript_2185/g.6942 Transcript_2185/m.6942 type:complete len:262 (+) Transcript_2185:524-1309(+)
MCRKEHRPVELAAIHFISTPDGVQKQLPADATTLKGVSVAAALLGQLKVLQVHVDVVLHRHDALQLRVRKSAMSTQPLRVPHDVSEAHHAQAIALLVAAVDLLPPPLAGLRRAAAKRLLLQKLPLPGGPLPQLPVDILDQPFGSLDDPRVAIIYAGCLANSPLVLLAHVEEVQEDLLAHDLRDQDQNLQLILNQGMEVSVLDQADLLHVGRQAREARQRPHRLEELHELGIALHDGPRETLGVSDPDMKEGHHWLGRELYL